MLEASVLAIGLVLYFKYGLDYANECVKKQVSSGLKISPQVEALGQIIIFLFWPLAFFLSCIFCLIFGKK